MTQSAASPEKTLREAVAEPALDAERVAGGFDAGAVTGGVPLFRPEALHAHVDAGLGRPVARMPASWLAITLLLVATVIAGVTLMMTGSYNRSETALGMLRAVGGDVRVTAPNGGILRELHVSEGDIVTAGQTLLVISTVRTGTGGQPADEAMLQNLEHELVSLQARLAALDSAGGVEERGETEQLQALVAQRDAAMALERDSAARLALAAEALESVRPVAARGFISRDAMRRREEEVIVQRQGASEAAARHASLNGQIAQIRSRIAQRPYAAVQERGQVQDLIAGILQRRAQYVMEHGYALRAPISGRVTAVQAVPGQAVDAQHPILTVTPPHPPLVAELYVPSRGIGFLRTGQQVQIHFDAFPFQRYGGVAGRVSAISASVLRPDEVQTAAELREPVYRVLVALDARAVSAFGRQQPLQPGMSLTAQIILERRNFGAWLLEPLLAMRGRN